MNGLSQVDTSDEGESFMMGEEKERYAVCTVEP